MRELIARLGRLLEELFLGSGHGPDVVTDGSSAFFATRAVGGGGAEPVTAPGAGAHAGGEGEGAVTARSPFLLSIDDAGQYLVVQDTRLVLGHLRGGQADLPFLADVGAAHAVLERSESLTAGFVWSIAPVGREHVDVGGSRIEGSVSLADGDRVRLGENLHFTYRVPDPASETVVLELQEGAECAGARRVLLLAAGAGGRVRIGTAANRHVRIAGLEHEISLVLEGERLRVRCAGPSEGSEPAALPEEGVSFPLPPRRRIDLSVGQPQGGRPPFGLAVGPADLGPGRPA
jgi:hypothetical protein